MPGIDLDARILNSEQNGKQANACPCGACILAGRVRQQIINKIK